VTDCVASKMPQRAKERYAADAAKYRPAIPYLRNFLAAFLVGGSICVVGQILHNIFLSLGLDDGEAGARMAVLVLFLGALFTGLGLYDELGRFGGAGSAIPISGFANAIVSPAMEFTREGYVLGMSAQLFAIAGPVIVFGVTASVIMAIVRLIFFA